MPGGFRTNRRPLPRRGPRDHAPTLRVVPSSDSKRAVKDDRSRCLDAPKDAIEVVRREPERDAVASGRVVGIAEMRVLVGFPRVELSLQLRAVDGISYSPPPCPDSVRGPPGSIEKPHRHGPRRSSAASDHATNVTTSTKEGLPLTAGSVTSVASGSQSALTTQRSDHHCDPPWPPAGSSPVATDTASPPRVRRWHPSRRRLHRLSRPASVVIHRWL
jgi:hypothetical protein